MRNRSLLTIALFLATGSSLHAQVTPDDAVAVEETLTIQLLSPAENLLPHLTFSTPPQMRLFTPRPVRTWLTEQLAALDVQLKASERALFRTTVDNGGYYAAIEGLDGVVTPLAVAGERADTVAYLPIAPRAVVDTTAKNLLPGILSEHADIGFAITGKGQLGGAWSQYKPCDASLGLQCNPGLFPQLRPDMTFGVVVAGKVADRINVDVNFDQANEFDAANNLNVYYQGLPNEILQRVEVGDVSIQLPASRYMTRGIPAGNFGFRAAGQVGPLDFQTVFAQQKGDLSTREFRVTGGGGQQNVVQETTVTLDDVDYVKGQFFFLVAPATITGAPYFDALGLRAQDAPVSVRPKAGGAIQFYRDERVSPTSGPGNAELGRFLANAAPPGGGPSHSGTFRRLVPDVDYIVHSSGLWVTLKSPLRSEEALAYAYVTESGDTIGQLNAESAPAGQIPVLRLLRGPEAIHQPGSATWPYEMHNVYRLDTSAGVELGSINATISLGDLAGGKTFQNVNGTQLPYVTFFGVDEDSPNERLDEAQIYQPSRGAFGNTAATISGTFIIFPALEPFRAPAAVASRGISAAELAIALGNNANSAIYNETDPVNRAAAARFKLTFEYRVKADGLASSFSLGAFGIREESERITMGGRELERGVDYDLDYDIGQLTLRDPQTLFATNPGAELRAVWEQKPLFQVAPTSVFGLNGRYDLGTRGELNVVGLYQAEKSLMARPQLGVEPGSIFLGGVSGSLDLGGAFLDRALGALPFLRRGTASSVKLTGELALSSPNPNTKGDAYLEDFESTEEFRLDPRRQDWHLGSRPEANTGDDNRLPVSPDATNAAPLVWTHDFLTENGERGGAFYPSQRLDQTIRVTGVEQAEYALHLKFGGGTPPIGDARRWRSLTTVLSTTGRDMSRSEYLEFYAIAGTAEPLALIFDIGTISEDAFYMDSAGRTSGQFADVVPWGLGVLDEEARLAQREVWGTGPGSPDHRGLWNQPCITTPTTVHPKGDPTANCTRGNGIRNTEDLDGNGVLNASDGAYFRYVVPLDQLSQYLVRDNAQTGTNYKLYRIPLRSGTAVNGANESTWRFIKHLRMTVAGEPEGFREVSLARMRVVGSRFTKRDITGVMSGLLAAEPSIAPGTEVRVGPVSAVTDAQYKTPGSVNDGAQSATSGLGAGGSEINEKSLRLAYEQLAPGDRAEVYYRYAQQPRSFMNYRQLRLWALPRAGTWGVPDGERLVVKIGSDPRNYYLFQTTLRPAAPGAIDSDVWLPEVVIDFEQWFALKAEAERRLAERVAGTIEQDTVWSADSAYAIVLEDRARAPNLQSVRELSFAVYNGGGGTTDGEIWINDMRLTGALRTTGRAGALSLQMAAGDFINGTVTYSSQDDVFQQLNENTSYVAAGDVTFSADARLDRMLPASWGVDLPLTVTHSRAGRAPTFLESTDVLASGLGDLRETGSDATRVGVLLSKRTPTPNPWLSLLIDGTKLRFGYSSAENRAITSRSESGSLDAGLSYSHALVSRSFDAFPGLLERALRALMPEKLEGSDAFGRLVTSRLRFTPSVVSFNTGINNQMSRTWNFDRILELPGDTLIAAIESPRQAMQNNATVGLQPFRGMTTNLTLSSSRDLLDPERATQDEAVRQALGDVRGTFAGMDVGWETTRALTTTFRYEPAIADWLNARYDYTNRYVTDRNASYISVPSGVDGDTIPTLQRRFESGRQGETTLQFRPSTMFGAAFGPAPKTPQGLGRRVARGVFDRFQTLDLSWQNQLSSQFERENMLPSLAYQLGLGNLSTFHVMGEDTAARALRSEEFRTTGRLALTPRITMDVTYRSTELDGRDLRGGQRLQSERGWPFVQLRMQDLPLPKSWERFLVNAVISGGVERVVTRSSFGEDMLEKRGSESLNVPISTTLTFPRGISLFYSGTFKVGDTNDPTGLMSSNDGAHSVRFSSVLPPPKWLNARLTQPLNAQLSFMQRNATQCRGSILDPLDCVAYIDNTTRTGRFELSTNMSDMRVGLSMDYNGRQNHVGTQTGTNQLTLNLFGSFNLNAGRMPASMGGFR